MLGMTEKAWLRLSFSVIPNEMRDRLTRENGDSSEVLRSALSAFRAPRHEPTARSGCATKSSAPTNARKLFVGTPNVSRSPVESNKSFLPMPGGGCRHNYR